MAKPKLMICGYAEHGKDTVAELLRDMFGYTFKSSSMMCAEIFIYDLLKDKYDYKSFEECYRDRRNHRAEWHDLIWTYNQNDPARLAREIYERVDIYVGIRHPVEFSVARNEGLFDLCLWVDASERLPIENKDSNKLDPSFADITILNNQTLGHLRFRVGRLGNCLNKLEIQTRVPGVSV